MKILKAKIKKTSRHYKMGLNQKGKEIWLSIVAFNPQGDTNFKIKAIKGIKSGFADYQEIWVRLDEITLKKHEDGQLSMDIFSPQELLDNQYNPRYFNQRRFEVSTKTEKQYFHAPDFKTAQSIVRQNGIYDFTLNQIKRLSKEELKE